ncbi:hypothetical protein Tco_0904911, partial [Tanacetum coccineum]
LKKFDFVTVKTVSTPIETNKALNKDEKAEDVDVHLYRSMIGSLMYLIASRPDIMFVVCACAWFQVTPKVLWIQIQMLDYGFNFMNTKIHIDNESTICIVNNPVFHSKTKHIEIRHHFIKDSSEKKLVQVIKIHTDHNVTDLLIKAFDQLRLIYKEPEDRMERAATTASSLEAEQDSGSGHRVNTLGSGEDSMKLKELMQTAAANTLDSGEVQITAIIDGKVKLVSEESIRRHLKLEDSDGITTLPNTEIFEQLTLMGASTRHKGKEIAKPVTPQSESVSEEDSDPEQAQRDKDMQKNLALLAKYFKRLYKPTNNNLRTSSNSRNKTEDTTPRYNNDNQSGQFGNQRTMTVAGARETECRKPKHVKDYSYHKEKMMMCKQAEQGVPLQAEQADWLADTDEEIDEQELEAHYSFMAKIQEVLPEESSSIE